MKASIECDTNVDKYHDISYYESMQYSTKNKELIKKETDKFRTTKQKDVSKILKENSEYQGEKVFNILKVIYNKNVDHAFHGKEKPTNSNLIGLLSQVPLLMTAYGIVRKNSGSTTLASPSSEERYEKLDPEQKNFSNMTDKGPDTITKYMFEQTSKLIKNGKYPWGTSRRIFIEKPGKKGAKRPLTIPPFMDRVLQTALKMILIAIYEPYFDKMNVSFGFRPGKSTHDAIIKLTGPEATGLKIALEGDIKSAYDKVDRKKLIEILGKKIKDRKFLNLIKDRLDLEYFDTEQKKYIKEKIGIPQGGSDAPYLWNIYMLEFDEFVMNNIKDDINIINEKTRGKNKNDTQILNKERRNLADKRLTAKKLHSWILETKNKKGKFLQELREIYKMKQKDLKSYHEYFQGTMVKTKEILKQLNIMEEIDETKIQRKIQKQIRTMNHLLNKMPYLNTNKIKFRILYARFADDWIILTNLKYEMVEKLKEKISKFLQEELRAILSEEKTLITRLKEEPAQFLGFEIHGYKTRKIGKYTRREKGKIVQLRANVGGTRIFSGIDRQRMINRLNMKGYCNENGKPKALTKLTKLDPFTIIERYNSVLTGLANYYTHYVRSPKTSLSRWIYILRTSCLKTLAQKYKLSLRGVYKKFKPQYKNKNEENTVEAIVQIKLDDKILAKSWKLQTNYSLRSNSKKLYKHKARIIKIHDELRKGIPTEYKEKTDGLKINSTDYLERINWFNIRTMTSFHMPCCLCGSSQNIQMHHIKHVRKTRYDKINKENTWQQIMSIKNRRQMPVCHSCHINIIHKGKYGGIRLNSIAPIKLYDNRILTIENYIPKRDIKNKYIKTLSEKGWVQVVEPQNELLESVGSRPTD